MIIRLKDGSEKVYDSPVSIIDIARDLSEGLARAACVATLNGKIADLRTIVSEDSDLIIHTADDKEGLMAYRHTTSHVMAQAVKHLFPEAKLAIGPAIDEGFYYDIDIRPFNREDLDAIEAEMKKIIKKGDTLERFVLPREEAIRFMEEKNEPYKVELIQDLPEDAEISFYRQGDFVDLCAGPHLMSTKQIKAFKLISSSGAYWRGDEKRAVLTRIYGTAFPKKEQVEAYLKHLEAVKRRDHNRLGRELELFTTVDVIGQGLPLFLPKGTKIIQTLQRWIEDEEERRGYVRTRTPLMAKKDLYIISDHWNHYKEGMFIIGDEKDPDAEVLALRPMTCPFQYYVYKSSQKSYRDLPYRMGETSTLFRNEDSGEMHGLTRVRQFTITEAHLIVTPEQVEDEFAAALDLARYCLKTLGLEEDVRYRFSQWDPDNREKYMGDPEQWESSQHRMKEILDDLQIEYEIGIGEAAFYGPKLDLQLKNVYGKEDTIITIQLDFQLAKRFDMTYIDQNGEKKNPYIIHRTSLGCYERTLASLIEKYEGSFPTWLAPEQVRVLPISDKYLDYANKVEEELRSAGILVTTDRRSEKIGYKIREAKMKKTPYLLIVGQKEEETETVSVNQRFVGDLGSMPMKDFRDRILEEIRTKYLQKEILEQQD